MASAKLWGTVRSLFAQEQRKAEKRAEKVQIHPSTQIGCVKHGRSTQARIHLEQCVHVCSKEEAIAVLAVAIPIMAPAIVCAIIVQPRLDGLRN